MYQTLATKTLFKHPRITLVEDTVLLPNGTTTDYLRFEDEQDAVTVICKDEQGRLLLQREYSHPVAGMLWQFPGGKIEKDELVEVAANRELQEESGFKAKKLTLLGSYLTNNRRSTTKMYVVLAQDISPSKLKEDAEEFIESHWKTKDEICTMIREGEIQNVNLLAGFQLLCLSCEHK